MCCHCFRDTAVNKRCKTLCPPRVYFLVRKTQMSKINKTSDVFDDDKDLRKNKAGEGEDEIEG